MISGAKIQKKSHICKFMSRFFDDTTEQFGKPLLMILSEWVSLEYLEYLEVPEFLEVPEELDCPDFLEYLECLEYLD